MSSTMMKAVFFAIWFALSAAEDPLKSFEELDPISKQVAATLEDALEQSNIETPWRHLEEFKGIRRLQERRLEDSNETLPFLDASGSKGGGLLVEKTGFSSECYDACPLSHGLGNVLISMNHNEVLIKNKYGGNLDHVLKTVKDVHTLILKMRPMLEDLYFLALKAMCNPSERRALTCMVTHKDKCGWSDAGSQTNTHTGQWSKDNAKIMTPLLECLCEKCPTTKNAWIKLRATELATSYYYVAEHCRQNPNCRVFQGGPPMPLPLRAKYEKETFAAICPMLGAGLCFQANSAQCGTSHGDVTSATRRSVSQALKILLLDDQVKLTLQRLGQDFCTKLGISTKPESVKLVGEIASNAMPVRMAGIVAALACALAVFQ